MSGSSKDEKARKKGLEAYENMAREDAENKTHETEPADFVNVNTDGEQVEEVEQTPEEREAALIFALKDAESEKLRAMAEMENVKKRLTKEKEEFIKYAKESVLCDMLPILDNLELALAHDPGDACKNFVLGVDMTRKIFLDALAAHDLTQVGEVGEPFDPNFAEALGVDTNTDLPDNTIALVMQKGYRLKDKIIRPAKVMVAKSK